MGLKRIIVDFGEKVSDFFASDIQNIYYKYLFLKNAKERIGGRDKNSDKNFCSEAKKWWKDNYNIKINPLWHGFYASVNGIKDVKYIPENLYYAYIEPCFNRKTFAKAIDDKCFYSERFPFSAVDYNFERPITILRNVNGMFYDTDFNILKPYEAALYLSKQHHGYVIKESITGAGGNRIVFVEPGTSKSVSEITDLFNKYKKDFVVESLITQCKELSELNPSSVNTIRFITFMDNEGVHLLSAVMRIGDSNSRTDNFSTGGICCGIDNYGVLKSKAYDYHFNKTTTHSSGRKFAGVQIPAYDKARDLVLNLHKRFGHFRIISWDITINDEYIPTIIEFNLTPQGISIHQVNNGPLFGDLTEKVLTEVFGKG